MIQDTWPNMQDPQWVAALLDSVSRSTINGIVITDLSGHVIWVNAAFTKISGYQLNEMKGKKPGRMLQGKETDAITVAHIRQYLAKQHWFDVDIINYHKTGYPYWVNVRCEPFNVTLSSGDFHGFIAIQTDIDKEKKNLIALEASEASLLGFRRTLDSTLDCVFMFDAETLLFTYVNQGAIEQLGYSRERLLTMTPYMIKPTFSKVQFIEMLQPLIRKEKPSLSFETLHRTAENRDIPVDIFLQYIEVNNVSPRFVAIVRDITEKIRQQKEIEYLAYFDALTDLPNRRYILKEIDKVIDRATSTKNHAAVVLIDMDDFKIINDTLGHVKGDEVLTEVTKSFQRCLPEHTTLARLGGDEFLVVIEHLSKDSNQAMTDVYAVAEDLLAAAKISVDVLSRSIAITSSIGIVLFNDDRYSTSELIRRADIAMYDAKSQGKNIVSVYGDAMHTTLIEKQNLLAELRSALDAEDQIVCWYQPKVDAQEQLKGYEALVRWNHSHRGLLSPAHFIQLAEDNNLICRLGKKVLYQACKVMAQWIEEFNIHDCTMAVNISQQQLALADFPNTVRDALMSSGLSAERLQLEVTESALAQDIVLSVKQMRKIKDIGVSFSLDDFGTGYSSLSYLQKLPISEVKIDRSFVVSLLHDHQVSAIVRAVVNLTRDLNLSVVCEGIEEKDQWIALQKIGCKLFQGYLFSKPLPAKEHQALMRSKQKKA